MEKYTSNISVFMSRKAYPQICEWWKRTTANAQIPLSKFYTEVLPSGKFHCKPISNFSFGRKNVADFRVGDNYVSVESPDNLSMLKPDDLVKYEGVIYRVESVTRRPVMKTLENMRKPLCVFVLSLVR